MDKTPELPEQRCETCQWWEPPKERPGLHQCFSLSVAAAVEGRFVATFRHEGCQYHAPR